MSTASRYVPHYTIDDYKRWEGDWELWQGIAIAMTPSPFGKHSKLLVNAAACLKNAVSDAKCDATVLAEIDWIIANDTVVRPDVVVVCGSEPEQHVESTPAIAVEILYESTRDRDLGPKRQMYEEQGVPYYLIIDPEPSTVLLLKLQDGKFAEVSSTDTFDLEICGSCSLSVVVDQLLS